MRRRFDKAGSYLITSHLVAPTIQLKAVIAGIKLDSILLLANEEADGVQSHLELWAYSDEARAYCLFHPMPLELKGKNLIVGVCLGIGARTRLDIALVVDITTLFA